jgi:hypothetical protein
MNQFQIQNPFENQDLFQTFCNYLSAHITSYGFRQTIRKWGSQNFNYLENDPILLLVYDRRTLKKFREIAYEQVLNKICRNLCILDSCYDVYRSEIADNEFFILVNALQKLRCDITIEQRTDGYVVNVPKMISDLIISPISVFHSYTIISLSQFLQAIEKFGGETIQFFLNAKGPTFITQFIETWIAHINKIPSRPYDGVTAVGRFV